LIKTNINTVLLIFAFSRPTHISKLLKSLFTNSEAFHIPIVIFIDGPRKNEDNLKINQVKEVIQKFKVNSKFMKIICRKQNLGCKENIISGVTEYLKIYESAIILEEDLVVDKYFLKYMLDSLSIYESSKKVFHISGYSFITENASNKAIFSRLMNCWGWATWRDRWEFLNKDVNQIKKSFSKKDILKFNIEGTHDYFRGIIENHSGTLKTWAVFWYATIFKLDGLCLTPTSSLVRNIGNDGSGERYGDPFNKVYFKNIQINDFPKELKEDEDYLLKLIAYFKKKQSLIRIIVKNLIYLLPAKLQKPITKKIIIVRLEVKKFIENL